MVGNILRMLASVARVERRRAMANWGYRGQESGVFYEFATRSRHDLTVSLISVEIGDRLSVKPPPLNVFLPQLKV